MRKSLNNSMSCVKLLSFMLPTYRDMIDFGIILYKQ